MKTKAIAGLMATLLLISMAFSVTLVSAAGGDVGNITLNDTTTSLNFYDAGTTPDAWCWGPQTYPYTPAIDIWQLTLATTYDALVEIQWFDWWPTNDVYNLYVDGFLQGTNVAGATGIVQLTLATGSTYEIKIEWIEYQGGDLISGGSYYDITFTVLGQYKYWFKSSGGGVSYSDVSGTSGDFCTLGLIGISLEPSTGIGDKVPCKGSGTFIDHDLKIKISFDISEGEISRADNLILLYGEAKIFDITGHKKESDVSFRIGLVDDEYGATNRFDVLITGSTILSVNHWHGTMEPDSEVTVWVWEA